MPAADDVAKMGDWTINDKHAKYFIAKKGGETIGYVIQSFGKGYSSYINTFIAVDKDFKVQKINILAPGETPGLGDEIETDSFKGQFVGKDIFKITLNLVIVYLIGGFILALVYANASPKIFRNNEEAEKKALKELMPAADDVAKMGDWTIHDKHAKYFIAKKGGRPSGDPGRPRWRTGCPGRSGAARPAQGGFSTTPWSARPSPGPPSAVA